MAAPIGRQPISGEMLCNLQAMVADSYKIKLNANGTVTKEILGKFNCSIPVIAANLNFWQTELESLNSPECELRPMRKLLSRQLCEKTIALLKYDIVARYNVGMQDVQNYIRQHLTK